MSDDVTSPGRGDVPSDTPASRPEPAPAPGFAPAGSGRAAYETHGISLVRYLVRRTAKTRILLDLADHLAPATETAEPRPIDESPTVPSPTDPAAALATFGVFCAAAAASFGTGYRQPSFDPTGTEIAELDPETGARIVARLDGRGPGSSLRLSVEAELDGIGRFEGREEIVGTTVGWRGLGMPAPSFFGFRSAGSLAPWSATARGTITAELGPSLRGTRVRGHGVLELSDDRGTRGIVELSRDGRARARTQAPDRTATPVVVERRLAG